jgi:hypothetical protein
MKFVPEPFANTPYGSTYYTIMDGLELLTDDDRSWYVIHDEGGGQTYGPLPPAMAQAVVFDLLNDTTEND